MYFCKYYVNIKDLYTERKTNELSQPIVQNYEQQKHKQV